ncbi:MAG TPA: hypothetical protein VGI33_11030 [Paenibacillus sp.]
MTHSDQRIDSEPYSFFGRNGPLSWNGDKFRTIRNQEPILRAPFGVMLQ